MAEPQSVKSEDRNKPLQPPAAKPDAKIEITYNTRFLAPPYEEIDGAAHLLRKLYPELPEELINECLTDRLNIEGFNKGSEVYVIVRKSFGRKRLTEAQGYREDQHTGARITVSAGPEKLAEEMKIYGPIRAKDHWTESENGWHSELNRSAFLEQVGKIAAPWAILLPDAPGKRGSELPKWVCLSSC